MTVTFSFELDTKYMKRIEDKSYYNHNYYELDLDHYGDYIVPEICDILFEYCDEFSNTYTYTLGYFEGVDFVECFTWTETERKTVDY